jgi:ribosomal protein L11 methylase PrmA
MILKDATPLNIQFCEGKLIFIDTLSFEKYQQDKPWIAYRQFCESFLLPLLLLKYYPATKASSWYGNADTVSINNAEVLPLKSKFNLAAFLHIHLQSKSGKTGTSAGQRKISKSQLINLLKGLYDSIGKLKLIPKNINWSAYYQKDHSENYYTEKKEHIESFLKTIPYSQKGLDIGCNTGFFSHLLSKYCTTTIATDADNICIQLLQEDILKTKTNIIPLVVDFCNPSPGTGLDSKERLSFFERIQQADIIIFLALAHHIVLSSNVPLPLLSKSLSEKCNFLIIEFCTEEDEKVKEIIARKKYHHEWSITYFEKYFTKYFIPLKKEEISNTRTLYLFKNNACD